MQKIRNVSYEFYLDNRNFYYLKLNDGEEFNLTDLKSIQSFVRETCEGQRLPTLIELAYGTTVTEDVQAYLAEASLRYSCADAILISTFAHKLMTTFYLRHYKPANPTRVFQDVFEALDWIQAQQPYHTA